MITDLNDDDTTFSDTLDALLYDESIDNNTYNGPLDAASDPLISRLASAVVNAHTPTVTHTILPIIDYDMFDSYANML